MASLERLPNSRLLVEEEATSQETASPTTQSQTPSETQAEWKAISRALQILSQRVLAALGHGISLAIVLIAALLWYRVMDNPNTDQLIGLGLYAVFGLAIIVARGR